MIFIRNGLIIGLIRKCITGVFKLVYKIISAFNLQLALLVSMLGLVVYLVGGFENGGIILALFVIALLFSIFVAVFGTVKRLLGFTKKDKKGRGAQIVSPPETEKDTGQDIEKDGSEPNDFSTEPCPAVRQVGESPVYYRVAQNPAYLMAEYCDRYELFATQGDKMIKIRTDYKTNLNGEIYD